MSKNEAQSVITANDAERYPLNAHIWKRDSTQEWVLELNGCINDCNFTSRFTEPLTVPIEQVAGLPTYTRALLKSEEAVRVKIVHDPLSAMTWAVRLIEPGEAYGTTNQLVNDSGESLVEFYDTRYDHTDLGQLVSSYYRSTLLENFDSESCFGLVLDGQIKEWALSRKPFEKIIEWLKH